MKYPIAIEAGTNETAWGVAVPDLPGCFAAGDTLDEAYENAKEAIAVWINTALDDGQPIPTAKTLADHSENADFKDWQWAIVDVDLSEFDDKIERINISIPKRVLKQIDCFVAARSENRSEFLASAALSAIYHNTASEWRLPHSASEAAKSLGSKHASSRLSKPAKGGRSRHR